MLEEKLQLDLNVSGVFSSGLWNLSAWSYSVAFENVTENNFFKTRTRLDLFVVFWIFAQEPSYYLCWLKVHQFLMESTTRQIAFYTGLLNFLVTLYFLLKWQLVIAFIKNVKHEMIIKSNEIKPTSYILIAQKFSWKKKN